MPGMSRSVLIVYNNLDHLQIFTIFYRYDLWKLASCFYFNEQDTDNSIIVLTSLRFGV
jgi:hypothetical protein